MSITGLVNELEGVISSRYDIDRTAMIVHYDIDTDKQRLHAQVVRILSDRMLMDSVKIIDLVACN